VSGLCEGSEDCTELASAVGEVISLGADHGDGDASSAATQAWFSRLGGGLLALNFSSSKWLDSEIG